MCRINVDIWLEEGNLIDLGNFRLQCDVHAGPYLGLIRLFDQDKGLLFAADTLMPGGVMGCVFGSGRISDYIQSLERLKGLNSKILLSGHGRFSDTPQDDVRIAIQRSHGCCQTPRNCSTHWTRARISSRSCSRCATSTNSTIVSALRRFDKPAPGLFKGLKNTLATKNKGASMKLYDSIGPNPRLVRMFMAEKGIEIPKQTVDLLGGENRQPEHLKRNPHGQMPALELDDGRYLSEITAICEYLEEKNPHRR